MSPQILILDDAPDRLELLTGLLQRQGYRPRPANTPEVMWASLRHLPPDLILLNAGPAGGGGLALCRAIKAEAPFAAIPILLSHPRGDPLGRTAALPAGAEWVAYPFEEAELLDRIRTQLGPAQPSGLPFARIDHLGHSLRGSLSTLLGFVELLLADRDATPESRERLAIVQRSGQQVGRQIAELLALIRCLSGEGEEPGPDREEVGPTEIRPELDDRKPPRTATILVIDDDPDTCRLLADLLTGSGFRAAVARSGHEGLDLARSRQPDLILLDIRMPGLDGLETCERLKGDPATRDIPVIFLSGREDTRGKVAGFRAGAIDYITKPFANAEVLMRVISHLQLARGAVAPRPEPRAEEPAIPALPTEGRHIHALLQARDILLANLRDPPRIEELARQVGSNRTTLNRLFKEHFGKAPFEFLRDQRLAEARRLLGETELPLRIIADTVGYQHAGDFATAYKKHFGVRPSEHRGGD